MADFLLALAFVMMLLIGYRVVSRFDRFLQNCKIKDEDDDEDPE